MWVFSSLLPAVVNAVTSPSASMLASPPATIFAPSTKAWTLFTMAVTASENGRLPASAWVFTFTVPVAFALMSPLACSLASLARLISELITATLTASEER